VTGSFDGDYTGTIEGEVDLYGNLNAVGSAVVGGLNIDIIWQGTSTISGDSLSSEGTWTSPVASGTYSCTGTTT
jgi:hypothetical protein